MSSPLRQAAVALRRLAIAVQPRPKPPQPAGADKYAATRTPLQQALKGHSTFEPKLARVSRSGDPSTDDDSPTSSHPQGGPRIGPYILAIAERLFPNFFTPSGQGPGTVRADPSADPDSPSSSRGMADGGGTVTQAFLTGPTPVVRRKTPDCGADESSPQSARGSGHRHRPDQILR